ncbi:hypothetical protein, partial [Escherichia coli]|uniref:hypothetical protein n=1 Tax=Escherichia coli TaxID=562 RepID=UPI001963840D
AGTEHPQQPDPQPIYPTHLRQPRRGHGQQERGDHDVLAQRGLYRRNAPGTRAIVQRQQREQQARGDTPQQPARSLAGEIEVRG